MREDTSGPIMEFRDIKEAVACLKEWQMCLGLSDWIIMVNLCEQSEMESDEAVGLCDWQIVIKTARIDILLPKYCGDRITRYCAEKTLVHELLHCKLAILHTEDKGFNIQTHQIQEDIAKSLIMAKYNITRDFFSNINYDEG